MENKISLVIPMYNSEKFIHKVLNSIISQEYENYEVVLVNDGSTDGTLNEVEKYLNKKIKCISIENSGPGVARKIGFQNSTGELLFFVDSDDYLPDNQVLSKINELYNKTDFDMLFFNFICFEGNKKEIESGIKRKMKVGYIEEKTIDSIEIGGALWEKIFKRSKMKDEYFIDASDYEDYYTTYKVLESASKIYFSDEILYCSDRDRGDSLSKNVDIHKKLNSIKICRDVYEFSKYKNATKKRLVIYYLYFRKLIRNSVKDDKYKEIVKETKNILKVRNISLFRYSLKDFLVFYYFRISDWKDKI